MRWSDHFRWEGVRVVGQTATGRVTVAALDMNRPLILAIRQEEATLNQTTGQWYGEAHIEKTQTVRSERSRASGEVEEQAGREARGLRLRSATLRPNGDRINRQ
jgi:hypothetical protein